MTDIELITPIDVMQKTAQRAIVSMVNHTIGLVRRKGPIIFDRLIGKWVTENSQLS